MTYRQSKYGRGNMCPLIPKVGVMSPLSRQLHPLITRAAGLPATILYHSPTFSALLVICLTLLVICVCVDCFVLLSVFVYYV